MDEIKRWMYEGKHLPPALRDFHDQKDLFKALDRVFQDAKNDPESDYHMRFILNSYPGWVCFHIFVVDYFLWYMARRGYTLQRARKRLPFVEFNPYKELRQERK